MFNFLGREGKLTLIAVIFNQHDHLTLSDISAEITTFTDDEKCLPDYIYSAFVILCFGKKDGYLKSSRIKSSTNY